MSSTEKKIQYLDMLFYFYVYEKGTPSLQAPCSVRISFVYLCVQ